MPASYVWTILWHTVSRHRFSDRTLPSASTIISIHVPYPIDGTRSENQGWDPELSSSRGHHAKDALLKQYLSVGHCTSRTWHACRGPRRQPRLSKVRCLEYSLCFHGPQVGNLAHYEATTANYAPAGTANASLLAYGMRWGYAHNWRLTGYKNCHGTMG